MTRIGIAPKTKSLLVPVYKPVGKTPLECVELYKARHLDPHVTVSYAGRLDPMAEGVLLLLVGDANARRREYEHLQKEYEVTVLVGFSTDTGDLMGKTIDGEKRIANSVLQRKMSLWLKWRKDEGLRKVTLEDTLHSFVGLIEQRYPMYSSAKVKGKPLYWWARQGRLDEIEIPNHMVKIDTIEIVSHHTMTAEALLKYIVETVGSVKGDFRQKEIIKQWKDTLGISIPSLRPCPQCSRISEAGGETNDNMKPRGAGSTLLYSDKVGNSIGTISLSCGIAASSQYFAPPRNDKNSEPQTFNPRLFDEQDTDLNALFTLRISCGSGTYMRQLVMDIGEKLGIPLCVFRIKRTRVGEYTIGDCVS